MNETTMTPDLTSSAIEEHVRPSDSFIRINDMLIFFIALVIAFTNSLLISLIYRSRSLRTVTNVFIVSMAVSDLCYSPGLIIFIAIKFTEDNGFVQGGYTFAIVCLALSPVMALVSAFLVSLDRYVAVCYPMAYTRKVTMKKAKIVIFSFWFLNAVFIGMCFTYFISKIPLEVLQERISPKRFIPRKVYFWAYALQLSVLLILIVGINIKIFIALRNNTRKISVMCGPNARLSKSGESMRVTKMLMTSLCVNVIAASPAFLSGMLPLTEATLIISTVAFWIQASTAFITPVIHIAMHKSYRFAFFLMFGCAFHDLNSPNGVIGNMSERTRRRRDAIVIENVSTINSLTNPR